MEDSAELFESVKAASSGCAILIGYTGLESIGDDFTRSGFHVLRITKIPNWIYPPVNATIIAIRPSRDSTAIKEAN